MSRFDQSLPDRPLHIVEEHGDCLTVVEDGPRYTFACLRHQFASLSVIDKEDLPVMCPHCVTETEQRAGRLRYAALQLRLTASL